LIFSKYLSISLNFAIETNNIILDIAIIALFYHAKIKLNLLFVLI